MTDYITPEELVRRALSSLKSSCTHRVPLWSKVANLFAIGSTSAIELCRDYDFNPDYTTKCYDECCSEEFDEE